MKKIQYVFSKNKFAKRSRKKNRSYHKKSTKRISQFYEPVGIKHIKQLKYLKQSINIWSKDQLVYSSGNYLDKPAINIAYIRRNLQVGHFTLKNRKEAITNEKVYPNNCFYNTVSIQTGIDANTLRRAVIRRMRRRLRTNSFKKLFGTPGV